MKRILMMGVALVMLVAATAGAQTPTPGPQTPAVKGANFVDADGDGICDRFEAGTPGAQARGQGRAQGPRDGTGQKARRGAGARPGGQGVGPAPGAGPGSAACDSTGPKGRGRRAGR